MTNQAAQTMPERALAAWTGAHRTDAENRAFLAGYETCQSDANAAALSQTAGVVEGWTRDVADAAASLDKRGDRQMAARLMRLHRDMLAAAPSESGGECNCASGRGAEHCVVHAHAAWDAPQPPVGASVSERARDGKSVEQMARDILADAWEGRGQHFIAADLRTGGAVKLVWPDVAMAAISAALEQALAQPLEVSGDQVVLVGYKSESGEDCSAFLTASRIGQLLALTQQRGECVDAAGVLRWAASVLYMWEGDPNETGYMGDFKDAEEILHLLADHATTTPQPSADAVRDVPDGMVLVPREPTPEMVRAGAIVTDHVTRAIQVYSAMLSAASGHQQNAAQGGGEK